MAGFYVVESELDTFAANLDKLGATIPTAKTYATGHIDTGFLDTGVILAGATPTVDHVRRSILAVLAKLGDITSVSATHIRETASTYRAADDETDRRIRAASNGLPVRKPNERPML
jgi:hypothetical protein